MKSQIRRALLLPIFTAALQLAFTAAAGADDSALEDVRNFHRVSPQLLTSGQIYPEHIDELSQRGITMIINLAIADPERNGEEALSVAAAGINYVQIPVAWDNPTQADLDLFFSMMDARGERPTLVHCFGNFRASAFTYLYRVIREGVPEQEARRDLLAVWTDEAFEENPAWRRFIDDQLALHAGG